MIRVEGEEGGGGGKLALRRDGLAVRPTMTAPLAQ